MVLYIRNTNISGNRINHNLRTSMNERTNTRLYKNISLTLYSRKGWCFCDAWEKDGATYTKREDFFPYLLPGARGCQQLHSLTSSSETPLLGCVSLDWLWFSALCLNLTTWFSSRGHLPVTHLLYLSGLLWRSRILVYSSRRDSLSKHTGLLGTNRKSMSYVI